MSFLQRRIAGLSGPLRSVRHRPNYHWFVVGTVCIGAFMAAVDASIINIALPVLKRSFHVRMHVIEWVSLVYLLALAGLIVPFGRLADMFGRRWMYALGFLVFIVGSLLCGVATDLTMLLVARVVQAIGAAMLQANSVSIITSVTPQRDRGKAIGIQASAQGIGLSLGPLIGGALISLLSWRWIFFVNVPIGMVGTLLGLLLLPEDTKSAKRERFDILGAVILMPTLVALLYFLNVGMKAGWGSNAVLLTEVAFVAGMTLFIWVEKRGHSPLVDLRLFTNRAFALGTVTGVFSFAVMYAVLLLSPFYLDNVQGMSPMASGLYLTMIPLGMTFFTPISGAIADRLGTVLPTAVGMLTAALGCLVLSFMGLTLAVPLLLTGMFFVGAGLGMFTPANNSSVMGSVPINRLGIAGGMLNMARTLGMGLGVTLGGLSYQLLLFLAGRINEFTASKTHMVFAFRGSFLVVGAIACFTLFLSLVRKRPA